MKQPSSSQADNIPLRPRRRISIAPSELICIDYFEDTRLPPIIYPDKVRIINLTDCIAANSARIEQLMDRHGAVLFRGFNPKGTAEFENFVTTMSGTPVKYEERSSPRSTVRGNIYTATDYPQSQAIFLHNEHSYARTFPLRLFFYCEAPASTGGETLLADVRKVYAQISSNTIQRFVEKRWMWVRNFNGGCGVSWQTAFQTDDKTMVKAYCRANNIELSWRDDDQLQTRQIRPAIARHPRTGEPVWFNHATFFHPTTLNPKLRDQLLTEFGEQNLPNNTYFGDGSPIEAETLEELRQAYISQRIPLDWRAGDILMLDNMIMAHGRAAFTGPRRVLFAMAEMYTRQDI